MIAAVTCCPVQGGLRCRSMSIFLRAAAVGLTALAVGWPVGAAEARPRLVVLVVIDQLTTEHLERYRPLLTGGLGRLLRQGTLYRNGRFAFASTETGPGHATIATGAWPNVHGIVANQWVDRTTGAIVRCVEDRKYGNSPHYLQVPGIADALKLATRGLGRVVSLSHKPRSSVLLGGTRPDLVVWYDQDAGRLVHGRWPGLAEPPDWYRSMVGVTGPEVAAGKTWDRFRPDLDYAALASPDDRPFEYDVPGLGRTFPRKLGAVPDHWPRSYPGTPAALEDLMALAMAAAIGAELGTDDTPDLLALGISGFDYIGHWYGPDSQESLDMLLRIDSALGALLDFWDSRLGGGQVLTIVTGDHGVMPIPEVAAKAVEAARIDAGVFDRVLKKQLRKGHATRVYLTGSSRPGLPALSTRRRLAGILAEQPEFVEARAPEDVDRFAEPYRTFYRRILFSGRYPDILVRHPPLRYLSRMSSDGTGAGTGHGSPYVYDQTVPIVIAGPRVSVGVESEPVMMTRVSPTIAAAIGILPPAAAFASPLKAVRR